MNLHIVKKKKINIQKEWRTATKPLLSILMPIQNPGTDPDFTHDKKPDFFLFYAQ
jgi:hypothetical protein